MNVKHLMAFAAIVVATVTYAGNIYWADANNGNDDYTGTARETTGEMVEGKTVGPRKSLAAAMALAKSGDTVYALPGVYSNVVDTTGTYNARVNVRDGVKLISTGGRDRTFIVGASATVAEDDKGYGLGADAVRCAILTKTGSLFGFTLTGGRTATDTHGGGVYASGAGYVVDCVISNCYAARGGAYNGGSGGLVNTIVESCGSTSPGAGLYKGSLWNCLFRNIGATGTGVYDGNAYNCTFQTSAGGSSSTAIAKCWNTVIGSDSNNMILSNCYTTAATLQANSDWSDPDNRTKLGPGHLDADANGMPVAGKNDGIDMAKWEYYASSFPAVAADYMYKDVYGRPRVVGKGMDVGAVECDWLAGFTADLSSSPYFAVTNFTDGVYEKTAGSAVAIPAGETLFGTWDIPAGDTMSETYTLTAAVTDGATLKVIVNGAVRYALTGTQTATYTFVGDQDIRFACEGESGEAVLSALTSTAHLPYFVAPAPKGNNANDGLTVDTPKETLAAIAAIATESGAIIHAAAGVYDKGVSGPASASAATTNRVILAEGVGLVGDEGAEKTFVEGRQDPGFAYSTNVIRCCYLRKNAWIRGFTLRGGAAAAVSTYGECGGGVDTASSDRCAAIECVFTNNVAIRGNSASSVTLIRCRVYGNGVTASSYGDLYYGNVIDSVFTAKGNAYTTGLVLNSTFDSSMLWSPNRWTDSDGPTMCAAFNSIIYDNSSNRRFYNCAFQSPALRIPENCAADDACRFGVSVALDSNFRPVVGDTKYIDFCTNDYYDTYFPAQWAQFKDGKDVMGGPRSRGAALDLGAGEFDWSSAKVEGLVISIADGAEEGTWDMAISRDLSSDRFCTGFTYDGEKVSFAEHALGWTWTRTVADYPIRAEIVPLFEDVWYVNPVTGSDTEKCGKHPDLAFATITKAMASVSAYGEIHCAAGTYSVANGNASYDGYVTNVVAFTADRVALIGDEGADRTIIEGVMSKGTDAVRGVSMRDCDNSTVRGFTIRNCATPNVTENDLSYYNGGGIYGGTAIDCVVSNCWGGNRGGTSSDTKMIRCLIGKGNLSQRVGYGKGGTGGSFCGCVICEDTYTSGGTIVNCTFVDSAPQNSSVANKINVYNSLIQSSSRGRCNYYNSVICGPVDKTNPDVRYQDGDIDTAVVNAKSADYAFDPITYRPLAGSGLIDAGSNETFAAKFPADCQGLDWAGGQRIYNGTVDIGAGEFDYRPAFAKELAKRYLVVDTATPTVELGEEDGLTMKDGDALDLRWELILEGACSFKVTVTGEGVATVTVDGADVTPDADGVCAFAGTIGEHAVSISYVGEGTATVDSFACPRKGSILLVR